MYGNSNTTPDALRALVAVITDRTGILYINHVRLNSRKPVTISSNIEKALGLTSNNLSRTTFSVELTAINHNLTRLDLTCDMQGSDIPNWVTKNLAQDTSCFAITVNREKRKGHCWIFRLE